MVVVSSYVLESERRRFRYSAMSSGLDVRDTAVDQRDSHLASVVMIVVTTVKERKREREGGGGRHEEDLYRYVSVEKLVKKGRE